MTGSMTAVSLIYDTFQLFHSLKALSLQPKDFSVFHFSSPDKHEGRIQSLRHVHLRFHGQEIALQDQRERIREHHTTLGSADVFWRSNSCLVSTNAAVIWLKWTGASLVHLFTVHTLWLAGNPLRDRQQKSVLWEEGIAVHFTSSGRPWWRSLHQHVKPRESLHRRRRNEGQCMDRRPSWERLREFSRTACVNVNVRYHLSNLIGYCLLCCQANTPWV